MAFEFHIHCCQEYVLDNTGKEWTTTNLSSEEILVLLNKLQVKNNKINVVDHANNSIVKLSLSDFIKSYLFLESETEIYNG
jgi:hypothetical protein